MSQAGITKISDAILPPDVPLIFLGNSGTGSAIANVFDIVGAGTISTNITGNTLTISSSASGTVTNVSGTPNRITVTNPTTTPSIDIDANYVGQSSITTLGTVATGTWSATNIALNKGGTNASLTASNGGIFYSTASAGAILSGTSTANQVLLSGSSTVPSWSTATYPATAGTTGNVLTSDGTNFVSSAPANSFITLTGTLTNSQIKALHGTPVTVLSAPGSGKWYRILCSTSKLIYGGTNAFTAGAAQTIAWYYSTSLSASMTCMTNAVIVLTATTYSNQNAPVVNYTASAVENQPLILYNSVATEITGNAANNNTVSYSVTYQIMSI